MASAAVSAGRGAWETAPARVTVAGSVSDNAEEAKRSRKGWMNWRRGLLRLWVVLSVLWVVLVVGTVYRREWLPHEHDVRCTTVPAPPRGTVDPLGCWSVSPGGLEIQFKRDFQPFAPIAARYAVLAVLPVIGAFGLAMLIKWIIGGFRNA